MSTLSCKKPTVAAANTPYIISNDNAGSNRSILSQLSPMPVAKELTNLSLSFGGDNVVALAEITAKLKDYNIGLMGLQLVFMPIVLVVSLVQLKTTKPH